MEEETRSCWCTLLKISIHQGEQHNSLEKLKKIEVGNLQPQEWVYSFFFSCPSGLECWPICCGQFLIYSHIIEETMPKELMVPVQSL